MKKKLLGIASGILILTLGGCGPVTFGGTSGLGLNIGTMNSGLMLAPPNCLALHSAFGSAGVNAGVLAGERMKQFNQYASHYSLASSDIRVEQALQKMIAGDGC